VRSVPTIPGPSLVDVERWLASVEQALEDGDATLSIHLGDHHETATARLWRGQVLVDWEPDVQAGGCLLRVAQLRRLIALHAQVSLLDQTMTLRAPGRVVAGLSPEHADLVRRLGGARRVELLVRLDFADATYTGGVETYHVVDRGQRLPLLSVRAEVRVRSARAASPNTSPVAT
jgi:hypothetical protein